jgi:hypothetical protein
MIATIKLYSGGVKVFLARCSWPGFILVFPYAA